MDDADRAVIFGREAAAYDAARPGYPTEIVDHVLEMVDAQVAVEVGAGTGKATTAFAPRVGRTLCLEPSLKMAEVLVARGLPGVEVAATTFEAWPGEESLADLIYAAQAWHWVDQSTGYDKARRVLKPGGVLALLWNVPIDRYGRFVEVYERLGPEILAEDNERINERDGSQWRERLVESGFNGVDVFVHPWASQLTPTQFRTLCSSYSDHMMIPEPRRTHLLEALENAVVESGGSIAIEYESRAFTGRA